MIPLVARRLVYTAVVMLAASIVVFLGLRITPGDPSSFVENPIQTPERLAEIHADLGLDRPLVAQYLDSLEDVLSWDLGDSWITKTPINELLANGASYTLKLAAGAAIFAYGFGIPLGVIAALRRNRWPDQLTSGLAVAGMAIPNFVLAFVLIIVFAVNREWLPVSGVTGISSWVLPSIVLGLEPLALTLRFVRSSVLEQLSRDYVITLRARGIREWRIIWRHVLRNSIGPVLTLIAAQMRSLLGYTLVVETIFRIPGLGSQLVNAVLVRDYPVALILCLLLTLTVIVLNFLGDLGQAVADPTIRRAAA